MSFVALVLAITEQLLLFLPAGYQRASDEIFPSELRAIISTRAVFRVASKEDSWTMLADLGAEDLTSYFGEMMYSSIWRGGKPIKVKVPYISEKKMLTLVKKDKDND